MKTNVPLVNFRRMQVPTPWWVVVLAVAPVLAWRLGKLLVRLSVFAVRHVRAARRSSPRAWIWHRYGWPMLALIGRTCSPSPVCGGGGIGARVSGGAVAGAVAVAAAVGVPAAWVEAMTLCGLVKTYDGGRKVPRLLRVRCHYATDEVVLRMPRGQTPEIYHKAAPNLAYSFDPRHCRVFSTRRDTPPTRTGRWPGPLRAGRPACGSGTGPAGLAGVRPP